MNQTLNQTSSYFETMLRQYAANTPCSQAIFAVNDDILLEYGSEIHSRNIMLQMVEDLKKFDLLANLLAGHNDRKEQSKIRHLYLFYPKK